MKKFLIFAAAVLGILLLAPALTGWKWRTHGGVYGTHGIAWVAHQELRKDVPQDNLSWWIIRTGSVAPDEWSGYPYYADNEHIMTNLIRQGAQWLRKAESAANVGAWDNVSYFLGVASHYWGDMTFYGQHDNIIKHYENVYGKDQGYDESYKISHHLDIQAEFYRPGKPVLIAQSNTNPYSNLDDFLADAAEGENSFLDNWMDNTMETEPGDPSPEGWWFEWAESRKAENLGIQAGMNPTYGSFESVDLATTLSYSGWVYAMDVEDQIVDSGRIKLKTFSDIDPNQGAYFASENYRGRDGYRFPLYS